MSKIANAFKNGKAFIGFLTAGDPSIEKTVEFIRQLVELRRRLVALKGKPLSWSNTLTAYFSRGGKISEIHSVGTWKDKGWIAKPGVAPFVLIGYDQKRIPYTQQRIY